MVTVRTVQLVNPRICSTRSMRLPLSLLALGAVLEARHPYVLHDGNLEPDLVARVLAALDRAPHACLGVTVMPGPQVVTAIELSRSVRDRHPTVPIVWGGYFPTLYPQAAINAPYVDYVVRGQGEDTLLALLAALDDAGLPSATDSAQDPSAVAGIAGITWKRDGAVTHNADRRIRPPESFPPLRYDRLPRVEPYLRPSFMGSRTAVHQAAIGCRYNCSFCGVVSMWNGATRLQTASRLADAMVTLRDRYGANALQLYDHNFFDTEAASVPLLEAMATVAMPWWCYARADTMAGFAPATWKLIEKSRLSMAYIGAEAASDSLLRSMKKGSRVEHTFEVAARCREHGVIPEFSFVLGGPEDPEGEIEKTFQFIKKLKAVHPSCEVVLYFYTPTPRRERATAETRRAGLRLPVQDAYGPQGPALPTTPEEWTEKRWVDFVCHQDAPWLSPRIRQRVRDFAFVLGCRFPTVQDHRLPPWGRTLLRTAARWRYATERYDNPRELHFLAERLTLRQPQHESL